MKTIKNIWESWDIECLKIYRREAKNNKLNYDEALKIFNNLVRPKNYKLVKSFWGKGAEGQRVSCSVFRKVKKGG